MTNDEPTTSPGPYTRLGVKYALIAAYGLLVSVFGIATITEVSGEAFGLAWPVLLCGFSFAALVGMNRSKTRGKFGLEIAGTLGLCSLLTVYALFIGLRTITDGDWIRLPAILLPIIIIVTPFGRLLDIVRRKQ